jgi:hypothetical protein
VVAERAHDLLALVLAHHPVVDEDARELVADRPVDEQRRHGGVHAAREAADDLLVPHLRADALELLLDDGRGAPRQVARADVAEERPEHVLAERGVDHLGVVLDAVDAALDGLERRHGRRGRGRQRGEARRRGEDRVAVRHPAGLLGRQPASSRPGSRTLSCERPYSPTSADSTVPPSSSARSCMP